MNNKIYDILKWVAQIFLPALGTLYFALAGIWDFPFSEVPTVSLQFTGANGQWIEGFSEEPTKTHAGKIVIASVTNKTANAYYDITAIGKWK